MDHKKSSPSIINSIGVGHQETIAISIVIPSNSYPGMFPLGVCSAMGGTLAMKGGEAPALLREDICSE